MRHVLVDFFVNWCVNLFTRSQRKQQKDLLMALQKVVVPIYCTSFLAVEEEKQQKITRVNPSVFTWTITVFTPVNIFIVVAKRLFVVVTVVAALGEEWLLWWGDHSAAPEPSTGYWPVPGQDISHNKTIPLATVALILAPVWEFSCVCERNVRIETRFF